jgi:hypothetical protein
VSVLSIDPGNMDSAYVIYDGERPVHFGKWSNESLRRGIYVEPILRSEFCAIETMKPRGMPTAFEEMQTQLWAGRFYEAWYETMGGDKFAPHEPTQVFRHDVKMHLCGRGTANDSNIRAALIDRFGGKEAAIGRKASPGPLYGIAADVWQALALAVYWWDTNKERP